MRRRLDLVLLLVVAISGLAIPFLSARAQAVALRNSGFEGEFTNRGAPELDVAEGWNWWAVEGGDWHRPEFKPETLETGRARVLEGFSAQKSFTTYAKHDGGLIQQVNGLDEGTWYRFSCHVYNWCSQQDNPDVSGGGKCSSVVGANPWGNAWPADWTTIWGKAALNEYNRWVEVDVIFQAWGSRAALFTRGLGEWPIKHQDWYWDMCSIEEYAMPGPAPTPGPGGITLDQVKEVVETAVANREPVRWPR